MAKDIIKPEWIPAAYRNEEPGDKIAKAPVVDPVNAIVKAKKKRPGLAGRLSGKY